MITRIIEKQVLTQLKAYPAVALLGARQVGKTTLAKQIAATQKRKTIYLDLESSSDYRKLNDAESFFNDHIDHLVIIDEVQTKPDLFSLLRSHIDKKRNNGRFLLLGSASPHLVKGVSESLAGRIHFCEMNPITLLECDEKINMKKHFFRGGFPKALMAKNDTIATTWLQDFISTYIERDLAKLFDVSLEKNIMKNFWSMLAHHHSGIWKTEMFARALGVTSPTVNRYYSFLEGAFLTYTLPSFHMNAKKRLVKAPKVYLNDSGMLHTLLRVHDYQSLLGTHHVGASWEGYVIHQIKSMLPKGLDAFYYRTQNDAEIDLVIVSGIKPIATVEVKFSNAPKLSKGYYEAKADLNAKQNFVITPGSDSWRESENVYYCSLENFLKKQLPKL